VACGVLLDSRDLPRSKRTQTIDNLTKHNLVVTYIELNENIMSKTQWHFHPKIHIFILLRKYIQLRTRQNKTLSDNLHYAACKQSHSA